MPFISILDNNFDFKYYTKKTNGDTVTFYFFLKRNLFLITKENKEGEEITREQHPLLVSDDNIYMWNIDKGGWVEFIDEIGELYSNLIAERVILNNE